MTTPNDPNTPLNPPALHLPSAPKPRKKHWRNPLIIGTAVLLVLLAWQLWDTRHDLARLQDETARRLADSAEASKEARAMARQNQEIAQALQAKLGALEARQAESQSQQAALDALYQEFSRSRDERALGEVEQAIVIADQQLQLASNVPAALAALQSADARLAKLDRPRLIPLRKLLSRDIERLKALPAADISGMSVRLDAMLGRIDGLPLVFEHQPVPGKKAAAADTAEKPGLIRRFGQEIWGEFRSLVRIERLDHEVDAALLSPEQATYLRENLRLRLLSARLALMQRDARVFNEDIRQARAWLTRYFDHSSKAVSNVQNELRQIENARLVIELPSLAETEAAVRALAGR